jgi:uncharacterized protein (TIGR02646 family)
MIYVQTDSTEIPQDWIEDSNDLTNQLVEAADFESRVEIIDGNAQHWKDLKQILLNFSHSKCWYSEARDIASYYHVDHFRPKKKARGLDGEKREGYWWLSFEWSNYRIAGGACNTKKGDKFPVHDRGQVATSPEDNLEDEITYLLDPTDPDDPLLLSFNEDGMPVPAVDEEGWETERARVTIGLLNLRFDRLVEERRKVWKKCTFKIGRAQNIMQKGPGIRRDADLENVFRDLRDMVSPEAELAGTARACLLKSGILWAQRIAHSARARTRTAA